ncbi:MAG: hypothetical protein ACO36I_16850, partial [Candidatus Latescibacterota bacterium]
QHNEKDTKRKRPRVPRNARGRYLHAGGIKTSKRSVSYLYPGFIVFVYDIGHLRVWIGALEPCQ